MPVAPEVMEIIQILDEEGFTELAGELLTEIGRGVEIAATVSEPTGGQGSAQPDKKPMPRIKLSEELIVTQRYFDLNEGRGDPPPVYEPIAQADQLSYAMSFIKLRLIEPMRRLAEAEKLAGQLASPASEIQPTDQSLPAAPVSDTKATRVTFTAEGEPGETLSRRQVDPGSTKDLDAFSDLLTRIVLEQR